MAKNRVGAIAKSTKDSSTLTGNYDVLCSSLPEACFLIRIINASNVSVAVSYDGSTDHDFVPSGETLQLSFQTNSQPRSNIALLAKNLSVHVKGPGGTGYIYLAGYYAKKD